MKVFKKKDAMIAGAVIGLSGYYADAIFRLDREETVTFGRDPKTAQIVMDDTDPMVSRTHCTVRCNWQKGTYTVRDLSSNGTFINGERMPSKSEIEVPRGSILAIGNRTNMFRLG